MNPWHCQAGGGGWQAGWSQSYCSREGSRSPLACELGQAASPVQVALQAQRVLTAGRARAGPWPGPGSFLISLSGGQRGEEAEQRKSPPLGRITQLEVGEHPPPPGGHGRAADNLPMTQWQGFITRCIDFANPFLVIPLCSHYFTAISFSSPYWFLSFSSPFRFWSHTLGSHSKIDFLGFDPSCCLSISDVLIPWLLVPDLKLLQLSAYLWFRQQGIVFKDIEGARMSGFENCLNV